MADLQRPLIRIPNGAINEDEPTRRMIHCTASHHDPGPNLSLWPLLGERALNARIKRGRLSPLFTPLPMTRRTASHCNPETNRSPRLQQEGLVPPARTGCGPQRPLHAADPPHPAPLAKAGDHHHPAAMRFLNITPPSRSVTEIR